MPDTIFAIGGQKATKEGVPLLQVSMISIIDSAKRALVAHFSQK